MKKRILLLLPFFCWQISAQAADLIQVYKQAQDSDPTFLQAIAQRLSTKEGVPISLGALLPNINFAASPTLTHYGYSGTSYNISPIVFDGITLLQPRNLTQRSYTMTLSVTQTIFDFAKFSTVAAQVATSKAADATLNAALQSLMTRVASAYFAVLKDVDNLEYSAASKRAYSEQLNQIQQLYKVGLKTLTDLDTANASYELSVASYIQAQTALNNDRENLRVITGMYYPHLATLSERFPLVSPQPTNIEKWVQTALLQNWAIRAGEYNVQAQLDIVKQRFAGHLPSMNVQGSWSRQYTDNINNFFSFQDRNGPGTISERQVALNINVPIFSGGTVNAQTTQATYDYQVAQQQLEAIIRNTINTTRQSYASIIAGISQIYADKQAIKSSISSFEGIQASYRVGTETLVDVLNQQQKVFQAQTQYATDRYAFVNNILALKQAAGTLSFDDLQALNAWLIDKERSGGDQGLKVRTKKRRI